ncbi:MAG: 3-methyladenine DNA glycosylase, partial [Verrucomicrobia bacterium]|nr:3-methyladenine DNA glycosylase [Verrucomicrobiota bacterium]
TEYEQAQRLLAQKAEPLRARLIAALDLVLN